MPICCFCIFLILLAIFSKTWLHRFYKFKKSDFLHFCNVIKGYYFFGWVIKVLPIPWQLYLFCMSCLFSVCVYPLDNAPVKNYIKIISFSPCLVVPSGDHTMLYFLICNCCQNCKMLVWMLVQMMTSGKNELMVTLCAFSDIEGQAYSHN